MNNENLKKRFLKYISFDTQSCETSETIPSTMKQRKLGEYLANELKSFGIDNAYLDEFGYVYGFVKSNCGSNNTIGLVSHMDTSPDASGENVNPQFIKEYKGEVITLNEKLGLYLDPKEFTYLNNQIGHELITTDGTTLLGADDKAGIAIIMTVLEELLKGDKSYPNIIVTFTPDEEIGRGADKFNYEYYKEHNCKFAYTIDGGEANFINYENFNAASCKVDIIGKSIHPGSAKNKMINASLVAMEFNSLLPSYVLPQLTEGYEGFNHLSEISGSCEKAHLAYIIRNHDSKLFEKQKEDFMKAKEYLNYKYGYNICNITIKDSYYNMHDLILEHKELLTNVEKALVENNLVPVYDPIRGGTDGARLSFGGVYTPNLGTGGQNYHGPYEYLDLNEATSMVNVVKSVLKNFI